MNKPISILQNEVELFFKARRYRVYVLGGFGVEIGDFSIVLKNKETNQQIACKKASWPVQTYEFNKRAKRVFIIDVPKEGNYEVVFLNPYSLKVKHNNLPISSFFSYPIETTKIEVLFLK
ncbi:hypothetical protein [Flavobacterium sp.]|uniref:hypothetical protein n=1 Tax=Flavobacterium sp. TaxID=239 RepID=UPI0040486609